MVPLHECIRQADEEGVRVRVEGVHLSGEMDHHHLLLFQDPHRPAAVFVGDGGMPPFE